MSLAQADLQNVSDTKNINFYGNATGEDNVSNNESNESSIKIDIMQCIKGKEEKVTTLLEHNTDHGGLETEI